jgi:hypothetical protein
MESGKIVRLQEILSQGKSLVGRSVRTLGRISSYDAICSVATLEMEGKQLKVDTRLVEPQPFRHNSLFQIIGEILDGDCSYNCPSIMLRARVCRCVDGLDVKLYYKALDIRRRCGSLIPDNTQQTNASV